MQRMLKIGVVCYPTYGGSGVVATELGKALADQGHEIHFITYSQPVRLGAAHKRIRYHEVNVSEYPLFYYPPYESVLASKMVDVVKYEKLDLMHVHYAIPHASSAITAKMVLAEEGIKLPVITTLHINKSDAVTAVSQSLKNDTYKLFGINQEIEVIPNFLNAEHEAVASSPELRREYATDNERIIIHMSNFRPVKRILDIIEVFARVQPAVKSKLILLGDGPERSRAEQKCRELNIAEHVTFVGNLKQPQELLSIGDLFILPSESESFGLAALEAMAAGLPVISTNTGGLPEVNRHGVTGMMSDVGDIEDMVKNCIYLLEDTRRLAKFKGQAKRRAQDFSIDKILPLYEQLYQKVIKHV